MRLPSLLRRVIAGAFVLAAATAASGQTITHLVVPFNAGGATDAYVRVISDELTKRGVQTIVENKPGASGMIAADYVARSKPDGLTLFLGSNSTMANNVVLFQKSASLSDLGSIARGFVTDVGALRKGSAVVLGSFYRPVFLALSTLYYQVVGGATFGWHLAAVVMAATVAALAARVFLRLGFRPLPSLLGAAVFSFHPAHVSSVAWAAGLQEQLVALFVLLAVSALLGRRAEERPRAAVGLATVAFVAALLSKEVAIALLPMAAAWAWLWRREDPPVARRFACAAAVFTGVAVVYLVVRVVVLGGLAKPWPRAPGLAEAIPSVPLAFVTYLRMLVWPVGFSFFRPERAVWGLLDAPVLVSIGIVALLGVGLVVTARRMPGLLLPAAWFVVWLLPVLNFWALRPEWMVTDRYLFLPSLGLYPGHPEMGPLFLVRTAVGRTLSALGPLVAAGLAGRLGALVSGAASIRRTGAAQPSVPTPTTEARTP